MKVENEGNAIIKIDLDTPVLEEFLNRMWVIKYLGLDVKHVEVYKTNHGFHIYIYTFNILTRIEILLFEQILGDDYRRGVYNYIRTKSNAKNFDPLYCRKVILNKIGEIEQVSQEKYLPEESQVITNYLTEISKKISKIVIGGEIRE